MIKNINTNSDTFKNNVLSLLEEDYEMNLDTSQSSFIYKIIDSISTGQVDVFESMNNLIDSNTFENLSGTSLDTFFDIFDIQRLQYSNGDYELEFTYIGTDLFYISEGTKFYFQNEMYETVFATTFQNYTGISGIKIIIKKVNDNSTITTGINVNGNIIDIGGIQHSYSDNEAFLNAVAGKITMNNSSLYTENIETDTSFLNRSKNLLQNYSSNSIQKIEDALREITTVTEVKTFEDGLTNKIIVIPNSLDSLETTYSAAEEIVNYFKNKTIVLQRPNYTEFDVFGVLRQINISYHTQVSTFLQNYISTLSYDAELSRNDFEFKLVEFLRVIMSPAEYITFDRRKVTLSFKTYAKCNKNNLIQENSIYENQNKTFVNSIFACNIIE